MTTRSVVVGLLVVLACGGCGDDPAGVRVATAIDIGGEPLQVGYLDTVTVAVTATDAAQDEVPSSAVTWSTRHPQIVSVSESGVVRGLWPGQAMIYATAGALVDSVAVVVHTSTPTTACGTTWITYPDHGFTGLPIQVGYINDHGVQYRGEDLLWRAGVMYGTGAEDMKVGAISIAFSNDFTQLHSCRVAENNGFHTVALLQASLLGNTPAGQTQDLTVVQEGFAFPQPSDDDYVLLRYTFTNDGTAPIEGLRFGVHADFDVFASLPNVASFDAATGIADVIHEDSVAHPRVGGFALVGATQESYRTTFPGTSMTRTPATFYEMLAAGSDGMTRTGPGDVSQLLGAAPFDLPPGASRAVWYVVAGGESRTEFTTHMARAISASALIQ